MTVFYFLTFLQRTLWSSETNIVNLNIFLNNKSESAYDLGRKCMARKYMDSLRII